MSYIDQTLLANEFVFYRCSPHWIVFFKPFLSLLAALLLGIAGLLVSTSLHWNLYLIAAVLLLIALLSGLSALVVYLTSEFGITNQRVIIKIGFICRHSFENLLTRIEGTEVDQSILGRFLNYGSIRIRGVGGSSELFPGVPDPLLFRLKVQEQLNNHHLRNRT
ncbi:MAG: PH domain-containing protein [Pseudomonadota bacterium]